MKNLKNDFLIHTNFLTIAIMRSLFYCSKKFSVFYQIMDNWKKFNETSLPEKEDIYSHLNIEDITKADYAHTKRVCKDF